MNHKLNKIVIIGVFAINSLLLFSQQANKGNATVSNNKNNNSTAVSSNAAPIQYISLYGKGGYTSFQNKATNIKESGGLGYGAGLGYEMQFNKFHLSSGLEFNILNSKSNISNYLIARPMLLPYPTMTYHYAFSNFEESWNAGFLNIPILFSYDFGNQFFATLGAKAGIGMLGKYSSSGVATLYASDTELIDDLTDMPNHSLSTMNATGNGNLNFNMNVAATAELGVNLDKWLAAKPRPVRRGQRPRKKNFKESLHYRASVFVDYGLVNVNDVAKNQTENGIIPNFVSDQSPAISNLNSILSTKESANINLKPFFAGIKLAVLYELPKKVAKRRPPVRTARPAVVPKKVVTQPKTVAPLLCGFIYDSETKTRISAAVELYSEDATTTLYKEVSNENNGLFKTELKAGTYLIHVTKPGYLSYDEKVVFVKDTLLIPLQLAKQGVKVVLRNVFFDFNKTTILPESDQALEDLYNFLAENPNIKIRISGHTDNIGSAESNQKLSENRAKSIMNYIVNKGIAANRITFEGKGEVEPCATNDTEEGRATNRRVEFTIL